jgi:hypothetical protein
LHEEFKRRCETRVCDTSAEFLLAFDIDYGSVHFLPFPVVSLS